MKTKTYEEFFKGGVANGMTPQDLADKHKVSVDVIEAALAKGQKVELEHTNDKAKAYEIAKDHIFEDPKYYDKLAKVENEPTNEALKMLMRPLMINIMKQFSFKSDPGIRSELEAEIRDVVQSVLSKHGIIVEAEDHEVGMAQGQLTAIIKDATELQGKVGTTEKDIPGWIQGHITSAYEYLKQANDNFHELHEAVKISGGSKYVISPVMSGTKAGFSFIGDSATVEKKSKQQQADEVLSSIRKFNKDLAEVLEYNPNHDAAGVVFMLNTYNMVTFLENNMK